MTRSAETGNLSMFLHDDYLTANAPAKLVLCLTGRLEYGLFVEKPLRHLGGGTRARSNGRVACHVGMLMPTLATRATLKIRMCADAWRG